MGAGCVSPQYFYHFKDFSRVELASWSGNFQPDMSSAFLWKLASWTVASWVSCCSDASFFPLDRNLFVFGGLHSHFCISIHCCTQLAIESEKEIFDIAAGCKNTMIGCLSDDVQIVWLYDLLQI
jgi:hypothetical protein